MHTSNKYYIALLPDEELSQLVSDYKLLALEKFGCSAANKSPAHITLVPPHSYNDSQIDTLKQLMTMLAQKNSPFNLQISGWNQFNTRTIYLGFNTNQILLELYNEVHINVTNIDTTLKLNEQFQPHITIANRDIQSNQFADIWQLISKLKYPTSSLFTKIVLFKYIENKWDIIHCSKLGD